MSVDVYEAAQQAEGIPVCECCRLPLYERERQYGRTVCARCEESMAGWLRDIPFLWAQLPDCRLKGTAPADSGSGAGRSAGGGSAAPGNLDALNLLAGSVTGCLLVHEDDWRRELRRLGWGWALTQWRGDQDQTLAGVLQFLVANLRWACHAGDGVDIHGLYTDLRSLVGEMTRVVTGEGDPRKPVGWPCPYPALGYDQDDEQALACGGQLLMDPRVPEIRCRECRATAPRHHWLELGITVGSITVVDDQGEAA